MPDVRELICVEGSTLEDALADEANKETEENFSVPVEAVAVVDLVVVVLVVFVVAWC